MEEFQVAPGAENFTFGGDGDSLHILVVLDIEHHLAKFTGLCRVDGVGALGPV